MVMPKQAPWGRRGCHVLDTASAVTLLLLAAPCAYAFRTGGGAAAWRACAAMAPDQPGLSGRRQALARAGLLTGGAAFASWPDFAGAEARAPPASAGAMPDRVAAGDVVHPSSLLGVWQCERAVAKVEGNAEQAALVWLALGGSDGDTFRRKRAETFATRFVAPPPGIPNAYTFEGETLKGVVLDRGFELRERLRDASRVEWSASAPSTLVYERNAGNGFAELKIVERSIELPSEKGWGGSELYSITTGAGGLLGNSQVQKAARVQRRFRRAFDSSGKRTVEGIEILRTYRVLDGVAGVEMPTSTTKSILRFTRPPQPGSQDAEEDSNADQGDEE